MQSAAKDVRVQHDDGAVLMASYGAAKATGQPLLAKIIKEARDKPDVVCRQGWAVDGLTAGSM